MVSHFVPFLLFISIGLNRVQAESFESSHPDLTLRQAFSCQVKHDLVCAEKKFREYLEEGNSGPYPHASFAGVLLQLGKMEEAQTEARRAIELDASNRDYQILLVQILVARNRGDEALAHLQKIRKSYRNDPVIEFYLADLEFSAGNLNEAEIGFSQTLFYVDRAGSSASAYRSIALWKLANLYLKKNDTEKAKFYLIRYLRYNPDRHYARFLLGYYIYFKEGDYDHARAELSKLLDVKSEEILRKQKIDTALLYFTLGELYLVQMNPRCSLFFQKVVPGRNGWPVTGMLDACRGEHQKAAEALSPLYKEHKNDFIFNFVIAQIMRQAGQIVAYMNTVLKLSALASRPDQHRVVLSLLGPALKLGREHPEYGFSTAKLYRQISYHHEQAGQINRAVLYFRKSIEEGEKEGLYHDSADRRKDLLSLARLLSDEKAGRYEEANHICTEVIESDPENGSARFIRALIAFRQGEFQNAIEDVNVALRGEEKINYYYLRAAAESELEGQFENTERDLKRVLSLDANFAVANNFLGYLYAQRGIHLETSLELIGRAVEIAPTSGEYQDSLGWVYFRMERYEEALYHLELAAMLLREFDNEDAEVLDHLGDAYAAMKYPSKALAAYRRARILLEKEVIDVHRKKQREKRAALAKRIEQKLARYNQQGGSSH